MFLTLCGTDVTLLKHYKTKETELNVAHVAYDKTVCIVRMIYSTHSNMSVFECVLHILKYAHRFLFLFCCGYVINCREFIRHVYTII